MATALAAQSFPTKAAKDDAESMKVGLLHSLTGFLAITEASQKDGELLAIEEINKAGGVLGKPIEPVIADTESKLTDGYPEQAEKLLNKDKVACVFGCWTSVSRRFVLPHFEKANRLLFYPMRYEGNECSKHVIYSGTTPNQQVLAAVDYFWEKHQKRKFYLLGSDYVFPRTIHLIVKAYLKQKNNSDPAGEKYVPLGHAEFGDVVKDIQASKPDIILSSLTGDSNVPFFDTLAEAKIKAADLPVCSLMLDEDDLRGLTHGTVAGHFAASSYLQSVDSAANRSFVKNFKNRFGRDRVVTDLIEAAYSQVYLWKQAVEKAKSVETDKVRDALRGMDFKAPGGTIKVDDKNQHTWKPLRIGQIGTDRQFTVVHTTETIRPEPFPPVAFPGWGCDWTKGGLIKGKAVRIAQ